MRLAPFTVSLTASAFVGLVVGAVAVDQLDGSWEIADWASLIGAAATVGGAFLLSGYQRAEHLLDNLRHLRQLAIRLNSYAKKAQAVISHSSDNPIIISVRLKTCLRMLELALRDRNEILQKSSQFGSCHELALLAITSVEDAFRFMYIIDLQEKISSGEMQYFTFSGEFLRENLEIAHHLQIQTKEIVEFSDELYKLIESYFRSGMS